MNRKNWYRLDNAAQIIPSSIFMEDTRVFRLVCELTEEVDRAVLQDSLNEVVKRVPYLTSSLRRGAFWYYLEELGAEGIVQEETQHALTALYVPGRKNLLFRVVVYRRRISLEMFHVLADGTGGFFFLEWLVTSYLVRKHDLNRSLLDKFNIEQEELLRDAFAAHYRKDFRRKRNYVKEMFPVVAAKQRMRKDPNLWEHLVEGTASTETILGIAHRYGVTLGVLITSVWIESILKGLNRSQYQRPVVVSVPVNLRKFFPTQTARNFYGTIQVTYDGNLYDGTLESILSAVKRGFEEQLSIEKITKTMNSYASLEHNYAIKVVPLFAKYLGIMGIAWMMNRGVTTSVSNVGQVTLPEDLVPYVDRFASFMACKKSFLCISTFADKMTFGIVSSYEKHPTECRFFRRLTEMGAEFTIASNDWDET